MRQRAQGMKPQVCQKEHIIFQVKVELVVYRLSVNRNETVSHLIDKRTQNVRTRIENIGIELPDLQAVQKIFIIKIL